MGQPWKQYGANTFPLYTNRGNRFDTIRQWLKHLRAEYPYWDFKSEKCGHSRPFWVIYYRWAQNPRPSQLIKKYSKEEEECTASRNNMPCDEYCPEPCRTEW